MKDHTWKTKIIRNRHTSLSDELLDMNSTEEIEDQL